MLMFVAIIFVLGLCLGSFVNALVWRIHKQSKLKKPSKKYSIATGRSMCVSCGHVLSQRDLVPVFSWLVLRGKCRYCKKPISYQYPLVEAITGLLFVVSYLFWPYSINGSEYFVFSTWLICLTGLVALFIYDLKWMILPNKIIFPLYGFAAIYVGLSIFRTSEYFDLIQAFVSIIVGGGIFYALFVVSKGKWIGGGDVKLGFLLGALVLKPDLAFLMLFIASLVGCLIILPAYLNKKVSRATKIPFGPFLIAGCFFTILFGQQMLDWYLGFVVGV